MIDIAYLRDHRDELAVSLARRGFELDLDALGALDEDRRRTRSQAEELRSAQNAIGRSIPGLDGEQKRVAIEEAGRLAGRYKELLSTADDLDKRVGEPTVLGFDVEDHVDLGVALGVVDIERATKISGSRFALIKGRLVLLELALVRWAMENLYGHGFTPVIPPVLVREHALFGTGFFPGDRDQVYSVEQDDLFLVGTSEVPLAAMHGDEILDRDELPLRYAGFSTCFRVEAGTYGKDTRGMFRVHQFDKVEMFSFVLPGGSQDEHEFLLEREEELVRDLEIPYRVVNVAAGDLGSSAAKKYDIEAWFPGQDRYREITSTSNTTDFQSRRLKIRYKDEDGKNQLVHTLNGTAVAIGRTLIALMENHQDGEGSFRIPEALVPYTGFDSIDPE